MAVEIPVYVDIQGAFDRAVQAIPKEIPKLEKVLSNHALNFKIDFGGGQFKTVRNLLTDTTMDAKELENSLKHVRKAFDDAVAKGANKTKTSATVKNLAKAYGLLEQRVKGFYNANAVAAMRLEDPLAKVTFKIKDMQAQLASLAPGSDKFNKINYELQIQKKRFAELTAQQMKYKAGIDASNDSFQKQAGIVKQLTGYFSGLYAAHTLIRFVKQVRDVTGELEYQRVALGHLLQDEAFGNELFAKTIEAAKESPFRIGQLVTYTKQLAAYRIEQENLFDTTQRLADISAGLGVDMNRLILAYGQVRAASVLRGQELRQFTEAGIPLVELLAEKFRKLGREGTTTADVFKLISERAVPFEYIKEIFEELTNAGGQFYKMQETQAKTLQGRWEKLKDAYDQALMRVGETDTFQSMNDTVLGILNGLAKNLERVVRLVNSASIAWIAYWAATKSGLSYGVRLTAMFVKEYGAVTTLKFGIAGLTASFKKLFAVLKANWVGLAISAVSGLVTWFTTFKSKTKEAEESLSDMQKAIERMKDANKEFEYGKGLVANYEELAKKTDRTARESERMLDTLNELERAFPGLTEKINNDNLSLEERIGLMREAVNASHDLSVQEAKNKLNTQNEIIRGLEDQEKAARIVKESAQRRLEAAQTAEKVGPVPLSQRYGPGTYDTAEDLKNKTIDAANAAKAADDAYEDIATRLAEARKEAEQLRKLAFQEDAKKDISEWQRLLLDARKYTSEGLTKELFTEPDIKAWDSLGEAINKLKPQFKEAKETYEGLVSAVKEGGNLVRPELVKERDSAKDAFDAWSVLNTLLGGLLTAKGSGGGGYTQDPFIKQLQERMKFMQDFKKGYDDLSKYMAKAGALGKESEIMLTRGLSLGIDASEQKRAAEDLSKWYEDTYNAAFDDLKKNKGVTGTLQDFLSRQITGNTNRDKMLRDFQGLIQSLFDAKTDFDTSQMKKSFDDALKKLSDEIKRSETARNFYQDILGLTGDEQLATSMTVSVYGDIGKEFKDRMQDQLDAAFSSLDWTELPTNVFNDLNFAFATKDFAKILEYIDLFPEEWQKMIRQMASDNEKYMSGVASSYAKLLLKYDEIEQERVNITNKARNEIKSIEEGLALEIQGLQKRGATRKEIQAAKDRASLAMDAVTRDSETQLFKLKEQYRLFFSSVGVISVNSAREVASKQRKMLTDQFVRGQISLSRYKRELKEIEEQLNKYSGIDKFEKFASGKWGELLVENLTEMSDGLISLASTIKTTGGLLNPNEDTKKFLDKIDQVLNFGDFASIFTGKKKIDIRAEANAAGKRAYSDSIIRGDSVAKANAKADAAVREIFDKYAQKMDEASEAFAGFASAVVALLAALERIERIGSGGRDIFDQIEKSGKDVDLYLSDFFAGVSDFFGGILDFLKLDISSGFSKFANLLGDARYYNREIKKQSDILENLQYQYDRLDNAIEKSFGADYIYNYNKQIENLEAQVEAYRKQAEAERAKGKAANEDTAKGYEKSARAVENKIDDMRTKLSEFFAGTDLTSAAEDFANAWIEAYKEFGSTTDAMSEKFNDMIQNMITRSLAAKIMQEMLQPIFRQIDTMSKDGLLATDDIAAIAALAQEQIPLINDAMTNLMTSLASAGLDVRASTAGFHGISKDIAGASEESILGLAAAINTQNFYISYVPTISENVSQILAAMTVGVSPTAPVETTETGEVLPSVQRMVYDHLPNMDSNLSEVLRLFRSVITTKNSKNYISVS